MLSRDLASLNTEQLNELFRRIDEHTALGVLQALQDEIRGRCVEDGLFWLRFVRTTDPADPTTSIKPFPLYLEYISEVWKAINSSNKIVIAKSRQMMASWLLAAYCCWWARFKNNQAVYWQSQKDEDANGMVALPGQLEGRCQFIESHLPAFLQLPYRATEGRLTYPNGSVIQALAGGADQIRGKVMSVLVEDEFAFQAESRGVYTAAAPLIQKGAKFIAVSTPNGSQGQFALLYHGHAQPIDR